MVRAADLDNDGLLDLVVDHRGDQGLLILRGLGDGHFESPGLLVGVGGDPYRGFALGDLDNDWPARPGDPQPARGRSGAQPQRRVARLSPVDPGAGSGTVWGCTGGPERGLAAST